MIGRVVLDEDEARCWLLADDGAGGTTAEDHGFDDRMCFGETGAFFLLHLSGVVSEAFSLGLLGTRWPGAELELWLRGPVAYPTGYGLTMGLPDDRYISTAVLPATDFTDDRDAWGVDAAIGGLRAVAVILDRLDGQWAPHHVY